MWAEPGNSGGKPFKREALWDALVVRSASAAGCGRLLNEGMQDGQTIDGVRIENPFG